MIASSVITDLSEYICDQTQIRKLDFIDGSIFLSTASEKQMHFNNSYTHTHIYCHCCNYTLISLKHNYIEKLTTIISVFIAIICL